MGREGTLDPRGESTCCIFLSASACAGEAIDLGVVMLGTAVGIFLSISGTGLVAWVKEIRTSCLG